MANNMLDLYYIDNGYIQFLKDAGNNGIEHNYAKADNQKPYLGIVLSVNGYKYFAPLSSPKPKYEKIAEGNPTTFKILKGKNGRLLGVVRLNNMLPVPEISLARLNINAIEDNNYKNLLLAQRRIILSNTDKIYQKAEIIYDLVVHKKNEFYCNLSNNFLDLECALNSYINIK